MKKILALLAVIITQASPLAFAEEAKDSNMIAVVDIQAIMKDSLAAKDIQSQIDKKKNEFQSEINRKEEDLRTQDKKLAEQRSVLSKEAFEEKAKEFKSKVSDVQRQVQTRRTQLENAYAKALAELQKNVLEIIADLAKEKGFQVALPASQILYGKESLNISPQVLEALNKRLPKVSVTIEEVKADKPKEKKE